ncbi:MAG TPA: 3-dehydroquinate synthase [Candidatus Obscuribacterales bacterium]
MRIHSQQTHRTESINVLFKAALPVNSRVVIGGGALDDLDRILTQCQVGQRIAVLCQSNVRKAYVEPAVAKLEIAKFECRVIELPDGEGCKTPEVLVDLWTQFQQMKLQRADCILAIGGGALTDLAGFAAATYLRGIKLILVPTTLLSQVDAAIGGKTGINLPSGKNLAGSFYFPTAVIVDSLVLATLPEREITSGLGEIIKYAMIEETIHRETDYRPGPRSLWKLLQDLLRDKSFSADSNELLGIITACIKMKLAVVAKDPHEGRLRRCLNLGHTLGHAVEKVSNYKYTHGEAVAIGTVFVCHLAETLGKWTKEQTGNVIGLLQAAGLPHAIPADFDKEQLIAAMAFDKKRVGSAVKWVLPVAHVGTVELDVEVPIDTVKSLL